MTFIYELDLNILKMYLHTKNEVSRPRLSNIRAQTGQTDRCNHHAAFASGNKFSLKTLHDTRICCYVPTEVGVTDDSVSPTHCTADIGSVACTSTEILSVMNITYE